MAGLNLTPLTPRSSPVPQVQEEELAHLDATEIDYEPVILELQDDLTRSRLREALWISIVVHLIVMIMVYTSPRWMPQGRPAHLVSTEDLLRQKELTYLEMPPDRRPAVKPRDTNVISDKDRSAMSRKPTIDQRAMDQLRKQSAQ